MDASLAKRIETNVDHTASALFGAAAGYAGYAACRMHVGQLQAVLAGVLIGIVGVGVTLRALGLVKADKSDFALPGFEPAGIELSDELLLTEVYSPPSSGDDELVLEDILAKLSGDSRVVRLFDPAAVPTPGQLKAQIDRHLDSNPGVQGYDASHALHEALDELRRSLR